MAGFELATSRSQSERSILTELRPVVPAMGLEPTSVGLKGRCNPTFTTLAGTFDGNRTHNVPLKRRVLYLIELRRLVENMGLEPIT